VTTNIDPTQGVELLLDVGLRRKIVDANSIEIAAEHGNWSSRQVMPLRHSPTPSEIKRALDKTDQSNGLFYFVRRAGSALTEAAASDPRIAYTAIEDGTVSFLREIHSSAEPALTQKTSHKRTNSCPTCRAHSRLSRQMHKGTSPFLPQSWICG
jgi:hypothetical protein